MTFVNEPLRELRRPAIRTQMTAALAAVDATLPIEVPVVVAGEARGPEAGTPVAFHSTDPADPDRIVAVATQATTGQVDAAVAAATAAQPAWAARPVAERAAALRRAAGELRARRDGLAALSVRECAKPWAEADADVCEAIDFLEYYAERAERLDADVELTQLPGERNVQVHAPLGVFAVIAPWNFPLAIAAGMTAAALVTGNAAVLKPAEQSPACGLEVVRALHAGGVPAEVLALLPGDGAVGAALAGHPGVHGVAFTGSGAVGLEILRRSTEVRDGQRHLTRVVAEMGGKNCIVVDADADLDDVVPAVLRSAFGFAGQKCSAASRVLVHARVADALFERLTGALPTLAVGPADDFATDVPPVVEAASRERVERAVAAAAAGGAEVVRGAAPDGPGWWCAPTIVRDPAPDAPIVRDELFGPVVTLEAVADLDEACRRVDALPFALTGGLFSRNPEVVRAIAARLPVGNLYVNRHITGAMVGRQPFGGNRLSGTGAKAGGPDYLRHFTQARVVTENTVRHGLVV